MAAKVKLADAGFQIQAFQDQPTRWGVTPEVYKRQSRFLQFVQETLTCPSDTPGCLGARMVAFDGIKPSHLEQISIQQSMPYKAIQGIAIDWLANDPVRWERRLLSAITLKAWPSASADIVGPCVSPFSFISTDLCAELQSFLTSSATYRREKSPLLTLELDAMCWWQEALPSSLFAHVSETLVLSALPRSALGRLESKMAIAPNAEAESASEDMGVASDLIDAALISQGADSSTALADTVLDILKESISEIDGVNKRHWLIEIQMLTNRAVNAGPRTAMLLAWAAEMCEFGTIHELNPADSTVSAYIRRALLPLHHVLSSLSDDLESADWRADNLRTQYQQLIATQSVGNQPTMRAALSNFHHFLVNWFDIEPLKVELFGTTGPASIRAEVVWEHELQLAMQWAIEHVDADMGLATQVILRIAFEAPARSQELTRLRMCNVKFSQDSAGKFVEIEIARHANSGRLKTPSSQRRLEVRSPELLGLLSKWLERRKRQGAPDSAYLFGDPSDDSKRYRPAAMLAWASLLLKAVTGDPHISMHTLRHTAISRLTSEVWMTPSEIDINRIEVVAAHAGHASGLTTLVVYSHQYEVALRMWLDRSMRERLEITGQAAANLLNKKSEALRKGASRAGKDVSNYAWDLLLQSANEMKAVSASLPLICCPPKRPCIGPARDNRQLTVGVMESVLQDTLNGLSPSTLANRYQLNERALEVTLSALVEKCSAQAQRTFPRIFARRSAPILELVSAIEALGIDFNRRSQPKYQPFNIALNGNVEDAKLLRGLKSWEKCYQGIYLSANNPTDLIGLLSLLKSANVNGSALRVCVQSAALGKSLTSGKESFPTSEAAVFDTDYAVLRASITQVFEAVFHFTPEITSVKVNVDVPIAYLRWDSGSSTGAAGGTTAGLSALMICIAAYLIYKESL